jgi:uncharacterized protein (DUF952 family)
MGDDKVQEGPLFNSDVIDPPIAELLVRRSPIDEQLDTCLCARSHRIERIILIEWAAVVRLGAGSVMCRAMSDVLIYHMCKRAEWEAARVAGRYAGSSQDAADGFIHFSTDAQIVESAAKHRTGQRDLVVLEVEVAALGAALRWEPSRGGQLFPHLYGVLPVDAVRRVAALPLGAYGRHIFPWGLDG